MITIKSKKEIELIKEACRIVALVHKAMENILSQEFLPENLIE